MLQIVICEDNVEYLGLIVSYVKRILKSRNIPGEIVCASVHPDEVKSYLNCHDANVLLFDIDLKTEQTGYDLALKIREINADTYLVFISEHLEYVLQSFKARPFDFLPKPVTQNRLSICLESIWKDYCRKNTSIDSNDSIQIKFGTTVYYVKKNDIVYISAYGKKLEIKTLNGIINCYETLKSFEGKLTGSEQFIRCHKSFIVNSMHIREIRLKEMEIHMTTGDICYIGKKYRMRITGLCNH